MYRRIVQPDEADVGADLEAPVEPRAREAAGEHIEVSGVVVLGAVVEAEGDGEGQRVEDEDGGEEDRDRDDEGAPRVLELARHGTEGEEAAVEPEDP